MSIQIITEKCSGCGACMDVCPASAISLVAGKAAIDQTLCSQCEACIGACSSGALQVKVLPLQVIPAASQTLPGPTANAILPEQHIHSPWAGTILSVLGQEVLPRLANTAMTALERRLEQPVSIPAKTNLQPGSGKGGRQRHLRKHQRGRF